MPRTSATTVTRVIRGAYNFNPKFFKYNISNCKKYKLIPEKFCGRNHFREINDVAIIDNNNKKLLITGHFSSEGCFCYKNTILFFMLRNPLERIISHYCLKNIQYSLDDIFVSKHKHTCEKIPDSNMQKKLKYKSFHGNVPWFTNFYCHALSGYSISKIKNHPTTDKIYNNIITNLRDGYVEFNSSEIETFKVPVFFGITEDHYNSMNLFSNIMGWNLDLNALYRKIQSKNHDRNYSDFKKTTNISISKDTIKAIKKYNEFDIEMYTEALKIYRKQFEELNVTYTPNKFYCKYTKQTISFK